MAAGFADGLPDPVACGQGCGQAVPVDAGSTPVPLKWQCSSPGAFCLKTAPHASR